MEWMQIAILLSLWAAIALFSWQYRECRTLQKREERLSSRNAEMSCFAYGAAHDLKAPLRAIAYISERLEKELQPVLSDAQKEDIILLHQRVRRMSALIDDLLAYWQAGQVHHFAHNYATDAGALIEDCLTILSPPPAFTVAIDPGLYRMRVLHMPLQQVFLNIIGNALKHHHRERGTLHIMGTDEGSHYQFSLSDDGPGIPDIGKEKIFEVFETLKPRDEVEGSGLGLSLVRRIVDRQNGKIRVEDTQGGGATFLFTWPKKQKI